jgi:hypothetical protein
MKYATFLGSFITRPGFDLYRASIPDEYFFIAVSMVVTGAVVILKWDRLFPDRQDYHNLAPLPLSTSRIFLANLLALFVLAALFAVAANLASLVLFPFAVTSQSDFSALIRFSVAHGTALISASIFTSFGLLFVLGLVLAAVPRRLMRSVSLFVRIGSGLALVALLGTAWNVPHGLSSGEVADAVRYIPALWFLDLYQSLLGRPAIFTGSSILWLFVTAGVVFLALALYAVSYRRHFKYIPEQVLRSSVKSKDREPVLRRLLDVCLLRNEVQQSIYHFVMKTIFRSDKHCLLLGVCWGIGLVAASRDISDVWTEPGAAIADARILSVALMLSYCTIIGLRIVFEIPAEIRANWIFRSCLRYERRQVRAVCVKIMLMMVAIWLIPVAVPLYIAVLGWRLALIHTLYVLACSLALIGLVLIGFRKVPFTCEYSHQGNYMLVTALICFFGFFIAGPVNARLEEWAINSAGRLAAVIGLCLLTYLVTHLYSGQQQSDMELTFEGLPDSSAVQTINLS